MNVFYYLGKHFQLNESICVFKNHAFLLLQKHGICINFWCYSKFFVLPMVAEMMYVGRTSQRLQECIKQKVPRSIRNHHSFQDRSNFSRACKKSSTSQVTPMTLPLDSISWKNLPVPGNTVTTKFLSLPEDVFLSISLLLKLLLPNLFNLVSVDTKNLFTV